MRHGKKFNHLGRTSTHRKAMLSNMAASLIVNKRITTTVAKAKALRQYVEPLITRSKTDTTQSRRVVFSYLQDKESSQVLFSEVAEKVADRPGGYTRIIKLGSRLGDNAEMALIELVDFNEIYSQKEEKTTRTRRSRRGGSKKSAASTNKGADASSSTEETPAVDSVASEQILETAPAPEEDAPVAEVETKDDGDTIAVSGEAIVGEPVAVEEVPEAEPTDEAPEDSADSDSSESEEEKPKQ